MCNLKDLHICDEEEPGLASSPASVPVLEGFFCLRVSLVGCSSRLHFTFRWTAYLKLPSQVVAEQHFATAALRFNHVNWNAHVLHYVSNYQ